MGRTLSSIVVGMGDQLANLRNPRPLNVEYEAGPHATQGIW